jgi:hypothetical protein
MRGQLALALRLGLGLVGVTTAACGTASSYLTPSGSATTLMAGWERHFALDWTVEPEQGDARRLRGYVHNQHGEAAEQVRVLAQALDASGAVVGQRITWVPGAIGGFGSAYFEVPHLPITHHYRLTVWDYTLIQSADTGKN